MSSHHAPMLQLPRCKHGRQVWERCGECSEERAAEIRAEQARFDERDRPYRDMIANHRRWFDGCAFCPRDALVIRTRHEHDCPYMLAMYKAASRFAVYLVRELDPTSAERLSPPSREGRDG